MSLNNIIIFKFHYVDEQGIKSTSRMTAIDVSMMTRGYVIVLVNHMH